MTRGTCSVDGCGGSVHCRALCNRHYRRLLKHGDPLSAKTATEDMTDEERLRYHGWTVTDSGCWEWNGRRERTGYARFRIGGRWVNAHRVAYEAWVGPIPEGLIVRHHCDNPPCINPAHLEVGTHQDNVDDAVSRGRRTRREKVNG